ncbi:hypothetical protein Pint_25801 [Pistacia integerrima]|uniref:Uncharacterized protein n=1 Tax=Pistacia integerrima TaxID=434235 RepID=A0ACC0YCE3_9ROSI|nr:hypothetical protein Pint_25801 [Pistacia integerrima]
MSNSSSKSVHILMIPFPASGHILPLLDLTHQLAIRGLQMTIFVTPKNHYYLNPLLSLHPSIETLVLPFPSHPSIPNGVENLQDVTVDYVPQLVTALRELCDPISHWFQTHSSPPVAIIFDVLMSSFAHRLVPSLGVKRIVFCPINANALSSFWSNDIRNISEFVRENIIENQQSWGLVFNSFIELESEKFDFVKLFMKHDRIWGVGPLLPIKASPERGGAGSIPTEEVITWLDSCHVDKSVVYVGFGSQITLNKIQMEALAEALEKSGVKFIWVVKDPVKGGKDDDQSIVPVGFEDRVAGRGLVIRGWAPQAMILKHRAVGSYLTHLGWGSVLEGLLGEVLLLAWPMQVDHFFNTKQLVDELGVAIRVCEGLNTIPDSTNLAQILKESVRENRPERISFMKLREKALNAIKEGGSSYKALDDLARVISTLCL